MDAEQRGFFMSTDLKHAALHAKQKPRVYLKKITFNDKTQLSLERNSIIVFTGANNSGKSQVLKDIETCLNASCLSPAIIAKSCEYDFQGEIDEDLFLANHFLRDTEGCYEPFELDDPFISADSFDITSLRSYWQTQTLKKGLHKLFIKRLCTESRLKLSNTLDRNFDAYKHPIYKLYTNQKLSQKLSGYFHQAFDTDLIVNRNELRKIPLHVGQAPDTDSFTISQMDDYQAQVEILPMLQEQGDGMRSFTSILLDTFTSDYPITLIDEPEAFLHPPQARLLGKMLVKNNSDDRQLLISTHSEDFLQGLLDAENRNVTVIRIHRENNINKMNILKNESIQELWGKPLLRYSNILSGLFHQKVVVCESDYDCLFYQAILNAIYEQKNEIAPDVLFTHCGGKDRIKDVVKALKAVNVPVVAICDFDLLNNRQTFQAISQAFGLNWDIELSAEMTVIYDYMNGKSNGGQKAWAEIKQTGKSGFSGKAYLAYDRVETMCRVKGLFVVPVGEMECFDKTILKEKKEWVYHVLENYNLAVEPNLKGAREFVQNIIDY